MCRFAANGPWTVQYSRWGPAAAAKYKLVDGSMDERWGSIITKECLNLQPRWMARDGFLIVFAGHDLWLFIFNGVGRPTQKR